MNFKLLIFGVLIFVGCKKQDDVPPAVSISYPLSMMTFNVGEVIDVKGSYSDNNVVNHIKIELISTSGKSVAPAVVREVKAKDGNFHFAITAEDVHLSTGLYTLRVLANDGVNSRSAFIEIKLNEVPRVLRKELYLTSTNGLCQIIENRNGTPNVLYSDAFSAKQLVANSYFGLIGVVPENNNSAPVLDSLFFVKWQVPYVNTANAYFNAIHQDDENNLMVAKTADYKIRWYSKTGGASGIIDCIDFSPEVSITYQSNLIVAGKRLSGNYELVTYNKLSGQYIRQINIGEQVVKFFRGESLSEIFVYSNSLAEGKVRVYYPEANGFYQPISLSAGKINDVVKISDTEFYLACTQGLYYYNYTGNNLIQVSNTIYDQLLYNDLENLILGRVGGKLHRFNSVMTVTKIEDLGQNVQSYALLYNK